MTTFKLADGTEFDPVSKKRVREKIEAPSLAPVAERRIRVEDLPTKPKLMNVIGAVLTYQIIGLSNNEICYALNCTPEQLESIVATDAFVASQNMLFDAFHKSQQQTARGIIAAKAIDAARALTGAIGSDDEDIALKAAESVLNRAGISGDDSSGRSNGLTIKIVRDTKVSDIEIKLGA